MDVIKANAKAWAALVMGLASAAGSIYPPEQYKWVGLVIALAGAIVVWATPNKTDS